MSARAALASGDRFAPPSATYFVDGQTVRRCARTGSQTWRGAEAEPVERSSSPCLDWRRGAARATRHALAPAVARGVRRSAQPARPALGVPARDRDRQPPLDDPARATWEWQDDTGEDRGQRFGRRLRGG